MSEEITEKDIRKLSVEELRTLGNFVRNTRMSYTDDLNAEQILALYHAASEYDCVESWLEEEPTAAFQYNVISVGPICALLNCENANVVAPPGSMHLATCELCNERVQLGGSGEPDGFGNEECDYTTGQRDPDRERFGSDHGN